MSCPNWQRLVREHDERPQDEAVERDWQAALSHSADCRSCTAAALEADPLLAFQRLNAFVLSAEDEQNEVAETRRVVAALRTGQRLNENSRTARLRAVARSRHARDWGIAAVLALALLGVGTGRLSHPVPATAIAVHSVTTTAVTAGFSAVPVRLPYQPGLTSVEGLNRPKARVYQLRGDHLSVVMIVDEKLNV